MRSNLMCTKCGSRDIQEQLETDPRTNMHKPAFTEPQPAPPWEFRAEDFQVEHGGLTPKGMAEFANAKLAEWMRGAHKVYGVYEGRDVGQFEMHSEQYRWNTHVGYIVGVHPIKPPDTAEGLLRDLVNALSSDLRTHPRHAPLMARARKLLGEK